MVYFEDSVWSQMCDTPLSILRLTSRRRCNLSVQTDFSLRSVLFLGGIFASSFSAGAEGAFPASGKAHAIPLRSVLFFGYRGVASSFSAGAAQPNYFYTAPDSGFLHTKSRGLPRARLEVVGDCIL